MIAVYLPLREHMIGLERQNVAVSNLTTNVVIMLGMWGVSAQPLCREIYRRRKKDKKAQPPTWLVWLFFAVGWLLIIIWMSLWGMPIRGLG